MNFNATAPKQSKFTYFNPKHPLKYLKAPKHSVRVQTSKLVQKTRPTTGTTISFVSSVNAAHYSSNQSMRDSNMVQFYMTNNYYSNEQPKSLNHGSTSSASIPQI